MVWIGYGRSWYKKGKPLTVLSCLFFSSQNRLTLHLNRKVSYNLEWIVLTWLLMDFLPVGTTSSLKLSSSHAVCNGEDASLFINLVVMQITASFFLFPWQLCNINKVFNKRPSLECICYKILYVNNENREERWCQTAERK